MRTAVWMESDGAWVVAEPVGFEAEEALHTLIEKDPRLLPLSGSPTLAVLGREVVLGSGVADLLGIESNGRPVVIEVKLRRNREAKREIVAQLLSYAAYLQGMDPDDLERRLGRHLAERGYQDIHAALATEAPDADAFREGLGQCLAAGRLRLVFVLDSVPDELMGLVAYLESLGDLLTIDLIQVGAYEIGGRRVLVPQRLDPERVDNGADAGRLRSSAGESVDGPGLFDASLAEISEKNGAEAQRYREWAGALERDRVAHLVSRRGPTFTTLLVRLASGGPGPVVVYNDGIGLPYLGLSRTVIERIAPEALETIVALTHEKVLGNGTSARNASPELLEALGRVYRAAAGIKGPEL